VRDIGLGFERLGGLLGDLGRVVGGLRGGGELALEIFDLALEALHLGRIDRLPLPRLLQLGEQFLVLRIQRTFGGLDGGFDCLLESGLGIGIVRVKWHWSFLPVFAELIEGQFASRPADEVAKGELPGKKQGGPLLAEGLVDEGRRLPFQELVEGRARGNGAFR
jgi:hypothetical protein